MLAPVTFRRSERTSWLAMRTNISLQTVLAFLSRHARMANSGFCVGLWAMSPFVFHFTLTSEYLQILCGVQPDQGYTYRVIGVANSLYFTLTHPAQKSAQRNECAIYQLKEIFGLLVIYRRTGLFCPIVIQTRLFHIIWWKIVANLWLCWMWQRIVIHI